MVRNEQNKTPNEHDDEKKRVGVEHVLMISNVIQLPFRWQHANNKNQIEQQYKSSLSPKHSSTRTFPPPQWILHDVVMW